MNNGDKHIPSGISVPQSFIDEPVDMGLIKEFVSVAEDLRYKGLWVQEKIIGEISSLEPINLLSYISSLTSTADLGVAVIIGSTRNPILLAKELASLDQMSGGRLILGYALGGNPRNYSLMDGPDSKRVRHFIESLNVIKSLWTEESPNIEGDFWNFDGLPIYPKPLQKPHPPIWFGGRHPDALKRAVKYGDGWMGAGSTTSDQFVEHMGIIKKELSYLNKSENDFKISKRVYVAIDSDKSRAEEKLRTWFKANYGNQDLGSQVSIWGTSDEIIPELQRLIDSGAGMLMFNPVFDHMFHLETIAEEVIPFLTAGN